MRYIVIMLMLILASFKPATKPKVFIVAQRHQADVIVTTVQQRHQADVVIAPNSWKGDWQLVDQKWQADKLIYITSKSWEADVKVFFE